MSSSAQNLSLVLLIMLIAGYGTICFADADPPPPCDQICSRTRFQIVILLITFGIIAWFLYKRYRGERHAEESEAVVWAGGEKDIEMDSHNMLIPSAPPAEAHEIVELPSRLVESHSSSQRLHSASTQQSKAHYVLR